MRQALTGMVGLLLATTAITRLASAQQVAAQGASAEAGKAIEQIVVTANKRSELIQKVPLSITALSAATLRQQNVTSAQDLSHLVPGFTVTEATFGTEVYTIRGVGFYDTTLAAVPAVSVYVDQVPLPFSIMTASASLDPARVEVLMGPQGTLFGQNSTGGAINYIPAKPTQTLAAGITQTFGNYGTYNTNGYLSGPITDTLAGRLSFRSLNSDEGWQQSETSSRRLGVVDTQEVRLLLDWHATEDLSFELNVNGSSDTGDTQAPRYLGYILAVPSFAFAVPQLVNAKPTTGGAQYADWDPGTSFRKNDRGENISLRGDYQLPGNMVLTNIASYNHFDYNQFQDLDGLAITNLDQRTVGSLDSYYDELRLAGDFLTRGKYVVGSSIQSSDVTQTDYGYVDLYTTSLLAAYLGLPPLKHYTDLSAQNFKSYAGFGNVDYDVTDKIALHVGGRYTDTTTRYKGCTTGDAGFTAIIGSTNPPGNCLTLQPDGKPLFIVNSLAQNNFSFRASADYRPVNDVMFYTTISRGYKAGGFPVIAATDVANEDPVVQEQLTAYEVGFKTTLLERTIQFNGAAFHYDYVDKQIRGRVIVPIFGLIEKLINIPTSTVDGAELTLQWRPVAGLNITGGGTYIHSRIGSFSNYDVAGDIISLDGATFPNAPSFEAALSAQYDVPVSDRLNAFVGANYNYASATRGSIGFEPQLDLPSYSLLGMQAGLHTADDKWRLALFAKNITNTFYLTGANRSGETLIAYAGMPRTYGASLTYRFQ